jgi:hypothetical protein
LSALPASDHSAAHALLLDRKAASPCLILAPRVRHRDGFGEALSQVNAPVR